MSKDKAKDLFGEVPEEAGMPAGSTEQQDKGYSRQNPGSVQEPQEEQEEAKEPPEDHQGAELIYFGKSQ